MWKITYKTFYINYITLYNFVIKNNIDHFISENIFHSYDKSLLNTSF